MVQAVARVVGSRLAARALASLGVPGKEPARLSYGYRFRKHARAKQQQRLVLVAGLSKTPHPCCPVVCGS